MKMYEKLWKEFEKSPPAKKEKETLDEAIANVYKEILLEQEEAPPVNLDLLISRVLSAIDVGLKNLDFEGLDFSEAPTELNDKKAMKIMVPVQEQRTELAEYIKDVLEQAPAPYRVAPVKPEGKVIGYTLKLGRSNVAKFVLKPKRGSGVRNIGDVSEGLLGSALAAKFIAGDKPITEANAEALLDELNQQRDINNNPGSITKELTKKVAREDGTVDEIKLKVALTKGNFEDLMNPKKRPTIIPYLKAAAAYANAPEVEVETVRIMTDNKNSEIKVVSDGVSGQKTTKIDVRVYKDGKEIEIGKISLKAGSTKQLGQIGKTWEALVGKSGMFPIMFGVTPDLSLQQQWVDVTTNPDLRTKAKVKAAAYKIYKDVYQKIEARLAGDDIEDELKFFQRLAKGTRYQATLEEEGVRLIQLYGDGTFKILDFSKLEDVLEKIDLGVKIQKESPRDKTALSPKLIIFDKKSNERLISMRIKTEKEGKTIRHYVEKESLLTDLLNVAKKDKSEDV